MKFSEEMADITNSEIRLLFLKLEELKNQVQEINHPSPWPTYQESSKHLNAHSDIQLSTIAERLDRIEKKINNRLNKTWLSVSDVIQTTGISRSTINRAISLGELNSVKNKGKRMIRNEWVDRWITGS